MPDPDTHLAQATEAFTAAVGRALKRERREPARPGESSPAKNSTMRIVVP